MDKRGQVTLYIVLGIIIVSLVGTVVFFRNEIASFFNPEEEIIVPKEFETIYSFAKDCFDLTSKQALIILGNQGGYIYPSVSANPTTVNHPFTSNLNIIGSVQAPYWVYKQDNNVLATQVPATALMQAQIIKYINENINNCLVNFSLFSGYNISIPSHSTKAKITSSGVDLELNYPVKIEKGNLIYIFPAFRNTIDLKLNSILEAATDIYKAEQESLFLEELALDMMAAYEEIPTSGVEEKCSPSYWVVNDLKENFSNIVSTNVPFYRITNTKYSAKEKYFEIDAGVSSSASNLKINFKHSSSWPFYLSVEPSKDGVIFSHDITEGMGPEAYFIKSFVCMNSYNFVYDIKYPVVVQITDDLAFKGEGYTFQYPMMVVIERNQPRTAEIIPEEYAQPDHRYCEAKNTDAKFYTYKETLDGSSVPLSGVDITYECINHVCEIGRTKIEGTESLLSLKIPVCFNGYLVANKEGYAESRQLFSSTDESIASITLQPLVNVPIDAYILRSKTTGHSGVLKENQQLIVQFTKEDNTHTAFAIYPDTKRLQLIPGDYHVKISLLENFPNGLQIESNQFENCIDKPKSGVLGFFGGSTKECTTITIPGTKITDLLVGYSEVNMAILREDLAKDKLTLYVAEFPIPANMQDMNQIYLNSQLNVIAPRFLNNGE